MSDLCEYAKKGTSFPHRCVKRSHDAASETADNQTQQHVWEITLARICNRLQIRNAAERAKSDSTRVRAA